MLRHSRLVMLVLVAMFVVAVPTALAQSPVADQYQTADPGSTGDTGTAAGSGSGSASSPVEVSDVSSSATKSLPFTGGQVALIALIGLGLLALGSAGLAVTRARGHSGTV
jgi:hypothetical protein